MRGAATGARPKVLNAKAAGVVALVVAAWGPMLILSLMAGRAWIGTILAASVVWLVPVVILVNFVRRLRRRDSRMRAGLDLAAERDGRVCPHCLGTPAVEPDARPCCSAAPSGWDASHYRLWWDAARQGDVGPGGIPWPGDERRHAGWRRWTPGVMTFFWAGLGLIDGGSAAGDRISFLLVLVPRVAIGYGLDLVGRAAIFGPPGHRICAHCGYPQVGETFAEHCPECGTTWRRPGGTRILRAKVDARVVTIGVAATLFGLALMFAQLSRSVQRLVRSGQSTAGLIGVAAANGPGTFRTSDVAWAELANRVLTPEEERALFDAVLDARTSSAFMSMPAKSWVQTYLAGGKASPEQLHRWRAESFGPVLRGQTTARAGTPLTLTIAGTHHEELLPPAVGVAIHIGAVSFEGDPPGRPVGGRGYWTLEVHQGTLKPEIVVTPASTGRQTLHVRLWLVARSYGRLSDAVEWHPDGSPMIPRDGLWAEPVDLSWELDVRR